MTQNVNEGFNSIIWRRFPKSTFASISQLKISLFDSIITFNDGYISRSKVLERLGFTVGEGTRRGLELLDMMGKEKKEKKSSVDEKRVRQPEHEENDYLAGGF